RWRLSVNGEGSIASRRPASFRERSLPAADGSVVGSFIGLLRAHPRICADKKCDLAENKREYFAGPRMILKAAVSRLSATQSLCIQALGKTRVVTRMVNCAAVGNPCAPGAWLPGARSTAVSRMMRGTLYARHASRNPS